MKRRRRLTVLAGTLASAGATGTDAWGVAGPNPIIYGYFRQRLIESLVTRDDFGRLIYFVDPVVLNRQATGSLLNLSAGFMRSSGHRTRSSTR